MRYQAVSNLYPNVHNQVGDLAFDVEGNPVELDESKIAEEKAKIKEQKKSVLYQSQRAFEYPSIQECIHALLDGGKTLTDLQAKRAEGKAKYPKPK